MKDIFIAITLIVVLAAAYPVNAKRPREFSKEAPIRLDFDMENIEEPKSLPTGYLYDWMDGTLFQPFRKGLNIKSQLRKLRGKKRESVNVNTWDNVPDSAWFTNRDVTRMSLAEITAGANVDPGPAAGKLTVIKGKSIGVTPGFWIKDSNGQIFIMKFDHPDYPELASGAEIIASKMFHAFGYNVPQNYIHRFTASDLVIGEGAKFTGEKGKKAKMTQVHLNLILSSIARAKDGSYRALASKLISGKPKGGFTFSGKRKDDSNDIIPHQMRRDLRGLRLFSAWTEHNDIRVGNTLDMYVEDDGRRFIKHYLIDFGSTFGSDTSEPNVPEVGHEHRLDFAQAQKVLLTAGFHQPKWRSENYDPVFSPAVGRYSTRSFRPNKWKANFPLAAFSQMTKKDGLWAARIIASFSPEQIRAMVNTAEFTDARDTEYLSKQIIERQQIIVRYYAAKTTGIAGFELDKTDQFSAIKFKDLRQKFPVDESINRYYEYRIQSLEKKPKLLARGVSPKTTIEITDDVISLISALGHTPENKGVAKLVINRFGEKQNSTVYLWANRQAELNIAGIVH